ncbi:hypothetical protein PR048_018216 [Dryococelus australis]|uniref:DUF5641 domain-containing protein n=1 Tax=Dryococelus australis TaxID=614101 RepID=A0ABQ9HBP8_9NEOP|nr:hypothetical protein PR048_018216 [Dryococelus australis]
MWSAEYLSQLQQRNKLATGTNSIQPGNLDNPPPLMWKISIIEQAHPGSYGLTHVVTSHTAHGTVK